MVTQLFGRNRDRQQEPDAEAVEYARREIEAALGSRAPVAPANPFDRAAADLAGQWDAMVADLEAWKSSAESLRDDNTYLRSENERLKAELAEKTERFQIEIAHQTRRADEAVADNARRKGKFQIIGEALAMVLADEVRVPMSKPETSSIAVPPPRTDHIEVKATYRTTPERKLPEHIVTKQQPDLKGRVGVERLADRYIERPTPRERTFIDTPPQGDEVSEEDAAGARNLIDRLHPVELKR